MNAMSPLAAGVTITELAPTTRIVLRLADPAAATGLALPAKIGTRSAEGGGPDEWLIEAPEADRAALLGALAGIAAANSAVEVSDRELTYRLEGPAVLDLLATGCPRDLARMPTGSGARTVFDTAQVVLTREADNRFHLTVWRSLAPHVRALLDIAARELAAGL
ncbi:MAG TPA: sarcosine oxidase subunit gamma family protein [Amaricoccus sp.]|uniref:sarcosine oxidase subunit gamma n=1 Tax=Amaricoccus sp. TaxID=1872485 RepID=UPI002D0C4364|nr:sarcosine oxidase subunit gamma family protein [Amaricoccus sp.]HRO12012.1 sarcosine oxidase subunit gamma family protein [Amaricoccus sp.]